MHEPQDLQLFMMAFDASDDPVSRKVSKGDKRHTRDVARAETQKRDGMHDACDMHTGTTHTATHTHTAGTEMDRGLTRGIIYLSCRFTC